MQVFLSIILIAGVVYVLWRSMQPRWTLRIEAGPLQPPAIHGAPLTKIRRISEFLTEDLVIQHPVTILAARESNGHLRTKIHGQLDVGTRQQIRNFLVEIL